MEDIIKLLIDLLDNVNIKYDVVTLKLREFHYCIECMQHFKGCKCEFGASSSSSSEELSDYESSIYEDSNSSDTDDSSVSNELDDSSVSNALDDSSVSEASDASSVSSDSDVV